MSWTPPPGCPPRACGSPWPAATATAGGRWARRAPTPTAGPARPPPPRARAPGGLGAGVHRLVFATGEYFAATGQTGFYPEVPVVFEVTDGERHYHVPLLLSPYAFSTYRGS